MVVIKKQLVASRAKTSAGTNGCKFITIHETANTSRGADAQAHANLQTNGFSASWHYTVDDRQAIQSFPHNVRCWHSGDGTGSGNFASIGIEICVNSDGDFGKAVDNAAELVRKIMAEEGIPLSNVVQHNRWSGKNCPTNLRNGSKGVNWADFIRKVGTSQVVQAAESTSKPVVKAPAKKAPAAPKPTVKVSTKPKATLIVDGYWGAATTRALQRYFGMKYVDGVISRPSPVVRELQRLLGVTADGYLGPVTYRAMQRRFGTYVDGVISRPSPVVRELQRRLNNGKL